MHGDGGGAGGGVQQSCSCVVYVLVRASDMPILLTHAKMIPLIHQCCSQAVQLHGHHTVDGARNALEIRKASPCTALAQARQNGRDAVQIHFCRAIGHDAQQCQYFGEISDCLRFAGGARSDNCAAHFHAECMRQGHVDTVRLRCDGQAAVQSRVLVAVLETA